jgi:hypothetical protein
MEMHKATHNLVTLAAAVTALLASAAANAGAYPRCDTILFAGATEQQAPNTPFVGGLTMTNLRTGESSDAEVVTMLLGAVSEDGSRVVTSHEIRADGEPGIGLVTFDDAQLIDQGGGVFTLISHMKVKSGNGAYNCGELVIGAPSTVSFDGQGLGSAEYSGFGRLCRCKPGDN